MTMEALQEAHSENRKAIDKESRDRTFRTPDDQECEDAMTVMRALKNILNRLERIEEKLNVSHAPK